jgi:hypothetical protein
MNCMARDWSCPTLVRHGCVIKLTLGTETSGTLEHMSGFDNEDTSIGTHSEAASTNRRP